MGGLDINKIQPITQKATSSEKEKKEGGLFDFMNKDIKLFGSGGLNDKRKESFYMELSILMEAGMDLRSSLELIEGEQRKDKHKELFKRIREHVIKGKSLSEALQETGKFSLYEIYAIQIGEETGKLIQVLKELIAFFDKKIKQRRQVIHALSYPMVIVAVAFGAVFFMLQFIVPVFADIFKRFGSELPAITQFIIDLSDRMGAVSLYFLVFILGLVALSRWQKDAEWYRKFHSGLLLRIPFVNTLVKKIYLARFCNVLTLLISSKIPLVQALDMVKKMVRFYPIDSSLDQIKKDITQGSALHKSMSNYPIYNSRMTSLIKVGEEVNQLDVFFKKIAEQYQDDVEYQTSVLGNFVEPLIIVFLGIVIGTILVAMYLPMFELSTVMGN